MATLNHPNIVQIYELASYDSLDFIVMEYVPGKTLAELLRAAPLSLDRALEYANQIASALAAAHGAGIVNRDIKPANIIVSDAGAIKMLDFGLARIEQRHAAGASVSSGPPTASGTVFGTAAYMSPEQAAGGTADPRSDVFSCGAVFYEMFTGRRAFDGRSPLEIFREIPC